jgi:hypothetical protein
MELELAARRVDEVGADLVDAGRRIDAVAVPASACGGAAPGALGDLGRAWDGLITAALSARTTELRVLAAAAERLAEAAGSATSAYRAAEDRRGGA